MKIPPVFLLLICLTSFGCASGALASSSSNLQTTTASLPSATVGVNYTQQLTAAGGRPPYVWSVVSGSLPPGINLNPDGVLSGIPKLTGVFSFVVRVTDSKSASLILKIEWRSA